MKILALDSSATAGSAALCDDDRLLALFQTDCGNTHSESLLPMALDVLKVGGSRIEDIELFAAAVGPGSFTGVRIGVSVLKGLAFGRNVPCAAVSTIEALAENAAGLDGIICPVMDARRSQVYTAIFKSESGRLSRLTDDSAMSLTELASLLKSDGYCGQTVWLVGDGINVAQSKLSSSGIAVRPVPELLRRENAYSVAKCALRMFKENKILSDEDIAPVYLRLPQAERERLEKENGK